MVFGDEEWWSADRWSVYRFTGRSVSSATTTRYQDFLESLSFSKQAPGTHRPETRDTGLGARGANEGGRLGVLSRGSKYGYERSAIVYTHEAEGLFSSTMPRYLSFGA